MKRSLLILLLLLFGLQILSAQEMVLVVPEELIWSPRVLSLINTVEIKEQDGKPVLLVYGTMPDGCERDTLVAKERQGQVLFVDVYHDPVPPSTVGCPKMLIPLALVVPLDEILALDDEATLPTILVVNDRTYRISMAQIEPTGDAATPPITLLPQERTSVNIDTVSVEEREDGVYLLVTGTYPEGCPDPAYSRIIRTSETAQDYTVDIFRAMDDASMCPDTYVAVTYEMTIRTPVEIGTPATFTVEGERLAYMPDGQTTIPTESQTMHVPHVIESVDVILLESYPVQIRLNVQGYQPDGCDVPVHIAQTREDTNVIVEIYRELPADAICTMVIKEFSTFINLEGGFTSGTYTIDVNGMVLEVKI